MKSIDTLVSDIYSYMIGEGDFPEPDEKDFENLAKRVADLCYKRFKERRSTQTKEPSFSLRMSNYGLPIRKLQYEAAYPSKDKYDPPTLLKFLMGDIYEAILLFLAEQTGHQISDAQQELVIDGVPGHPDAVIDGVLVDIKSASKYSYKTKFSQGNLFRDDPFGYIPQIKAYGEALNKDKQAFLAVNKETGELCLLEVPASVHYDVREKIEETRRFLAPGAPLAPRCYADEPEGESGNRVLNGNCEYCRFKDMCWPGLRKFKYASGVKNFTKVVKTPKVPEVTNPLGGPPEED